MGICGQNKGFDEKDTEHAFFIPESSSEKLFNSIVKITINDNSIATGFFMKTKINQKQYHFLLTCNHVITDEHISGMVNIEISYGKLGQETKKHIKLDENERFIKTFGNPADVALIQILENDNIPEEKFLLPDLNYKNGYQFYKDKNFYLAGYPFIEGNKRERSISSGKIKAIKTNNIEFIHSLDTRSGSSGSPICLIDNKCVIGIHKKGDQIRPFNYGTFIGYILDELEKNGIEENNKIYTILPENEESDAKLCKKCGEIYQILGLSQRQGDAKVVPQWWILGKSGIKEPKLGIKTCVLRSFFIQFEPWIWEEDEDDEGYTIFNCISHYDDKALEEIDNGNCIMKGCDGKLCKIKFHKKPFESNI